MTIRQLTRVLLVGFLIGCGVELAWPTHAQTIGNLFNRVISFDSSSNPIFTAASAGAQSSTGNLANRRINFDASGNPIIAMTGVSLVSATGNVVAATNVGTASIATYTVGAADGTFEVGCNVLVTTSTTHSFSCDVTYTDESNTARTMVMPMVALAGTFVTTGLITNATGAGPYESPAITIRAKAATAITVRTSAGGTFTAVVYNARGIIKQVA